MEISRARALRVAGEGGGVLAMVAVWLPLLVVMATFVIDVGNWFEHKRHLQLQADASALAAGGVFNECFTSPGSANNNIKAEARKYGGDESLAGSVNRQIGNTNHGGLISTTANTILFNSSTYPNGVGEETPANTPHGSDPCAAMMLDVKLGERDLPWLLGLVPGRVVPWITARARVEIKQVTTQSGTLPIGVPEADPKAAAVTFIDEDTGQVLGSSPLTRNGNTGNGLARWDNSAAPPTVNVHPGTKNIGVRVALSGDASTTTCGQPRVECYDLADPNRGIVFVRGWTAEGSAAGTADPIARSVTLFNGPGCTDPYFFSLDTACSSIGVRAFVDIGSHVPASAKMSVQGGNCPNKGCPLTYVGTSGGYTEWQSLDDGSPSTTDFVPVPSGHTGRLPISIDWEVTDGQVGAETCNGGGGNKCKGTFTNVQNGFGAYDPQSGPVRLAQVWNGSTQWANSLERPAVGSPTPNQYQLAVIIGVVPSLQNASLDGDLSNDPIVRLRVVGSQNQSIDCDPAKTPDPRAEIATGCAPTYTVNNTGACPAYNVLWTLAQPWDCVKTQTGGAIGQVVQGMDDRILAGGTCAQHPNNWPTAAGPWAPAPNDTRVVHVFLVSFGAFSGSGNDIFPITGFATFYVTGWGHNGGGGGSAGCPGDTGPPPAGYIEGHFFKYIATLNTGGGGVQCSATSLGTCVAVMTR
jgi:hypothetical protein